MARKKLSTWNKRTYEITTNRLRWYSGSLFRYTLCSLFNTKWSLSMTMLGTVAGNVVVNSVSWFPISTSGFSLKEECIQVRKSLRISRRPLGLGVQFFTFIYLTISKLSCLIGLYVLVMTAVPCPHLDMRFICSIQLAWYCFVCGATLVIFRFGGRVGQNLIIRGTKNTDTVVMITINSLIYFSKKMNVGFVYTYPTRYGKI